MYIRGLKEKGLKQQNRSRWTRVYCIRIAECPYRVGQKSKPDNFCNNFVYYVGQFS